MRCVCIESIPVFVVCAKYCKLVLMDLSQGSLLVNPSTSQDLPLQPLKKSLSQLVLIQTNNVQCYARAIPPISLSRPSHPMKPTIRSHFLENPDKTGKIGRNLKFLVKAPLSDCRLFDATPAMVGGSHLSPKSKKISSPPVTLTPVILILSSLILCLLRPN